MPYRTFIVEDPLNMGNLTRAYEFLISQDRVPLGAESPEDLGRIASERGGLNIVFTLDDEQVIGTLVGSLAYDNMEFQLRGGLEPTIYYLVGRVALDYQQQGIMKTMIKVIEPLAGEAGCTHLGIAEDHNLNIGKFLAKLGFFDFGHNMPRNKPKQRSDDFDELLEQGEEPAERTRFVRQIGTPFGGQDDI